MNVGLSLPYRALYLPRLCPAKQNPPFFLASLSDVQKTRFSSWIAQIFGFEIQIGQLEGHIKLNVKAGDQEVNVADTGYGVSQLLPVLGAIWWASENNEQVKRRYRYPRLNWTTVAIEQPELHLHPAHQAKLAETFVQALTESTTGRKKTNFIIETHSEALIGRLGALIEEERVKADDIQIIIFSADDDVHSPVSVTTAYFDNRGRLIDWPYGFFGHN